MRSKQKLGFRLSASALAMSLLMSLTAFPAAAADLKRGAKIYQIMCAKCHGKSGKGDGPKAGELEKKPADYTQPGFFDKHPDEKLKTVVRKGEPPMPAFGDRLKDADVDNVLAYIKTFAGGGN